MYTKVNAPPLCIEFKVKDTDFGHTLQVIYHTRCSFFESFDAYNV